MADFKGIPTVKQIEKWLTEDCTSFAPYVCAKAIHKRLVNLEKDWFKTMAFGKIKITQADKTFSLFIRTRDEWTCQYCGKECIARKYGVDIALVKMDCAHIMPRNHQSTRYNPTNAICLCFRCHQGFSHAEKEFPNWEKWNKKRMGKGNYELLKYMSKQRGHKLNKTEEKILVIALKQEINALNRR